MTRSLIIILTAGLLFGLSGGVMAGWHRQALGGNPHQVVADAGIGHPIYKLDPTDNRALLPMQPIFSSAGSAARQAPSGRRPRRRGRSCRNRSSLSRSCN